MGRKVVSTVTYDTGKRVGPIPVKSWTCDNCKLMHSIVALEKFGLEKWTIQLNQLSLK